VDLARVYCSAASCMLLSQSSGVHLHRLPQLPAAAPALPLLLQAYVQLQDFCIVLSTFHVLTSCLSCMQLHMHCHSCCTCADSAARYLLFAFYFVRFLCKRPGTTSVDTLTARLCQSVCLQVAHVVTGTRPPQWCATGVASLCNAQLAAFLAL
jgi:hypothetical protein